MVSKNLLAELDPLGCHVVENNILVDEDTIGDCVIALHINVSGVGQLSGLFNDLAIETPLAA